MQVTLNLSSPSPTQKYIYDHILNTAGWFSGSDRKSPHFNFTFLDKKGNSIQQKSELEYAVNLDSDTFNIMLQTLSCRNTRNPEEEPQPLFKPRVDLMIHQYQQDIVSFCGQHKIPFISKMAWPNGLPFAMIVTHDIDMTRKYGLRSLFKDIYTGKFGEFADHYKQSVYKNNIYWNFDTLLDYYRERKLKSSFFFIAKPWENLNYRYHIDSGKFRNLFDMLLQDHHEIGLHCSRYAFDHPTRIKKEKEKLQKISGAELKGVRQHYLRLTFPQGWRNFQNHDFIYDSSAGYNESMGYRAGTSLPFRAFDIKKEEILNLYEIPFNVMDYPWEEIISKSSENKDLFKDFTDQIESTNGLLHILWHPHNLVEPEFKPLWRRILDWIEPKQYYNDSLVNILDWWKKRAEVELTRLSHGESSLDFTIESRNHINNLCFRIISPRPLQPNEYLSRCKPEDQLKYQLRLPLLKPGIQELSLPFVK